MSFNLKQLAKFIRAYKTKHNLGTTGKSYIEWLMLASTEIAKITFPFEEVKSITITDRSRKCLEK